MSGKKGNETKDFVHHQLCQAGSLMAMRHYCPLQLAFICFCLWLFFADYLNSKDPRESSISSSNNSFGVHLSAMTTPHRLLDIEDALVSESNPARTDGPLDYERCARLHNYLVAYGWMAWHGRGEQDLDELLSQPSFYERDHFGSDLPRDQLDLALISFLESIILPDEGVFFWASEVAASPADWFFFEEENDLDDMERFVVIYNSPSELGSHNVGLVYDQQLYRAAMPIAQENIDSLTPIEEHSDLWYPLETILSNWIHMIRIGKVTASPYVREFPMQRSKFGAWDWQPYGPAQIDSTVTAMDRLSAEIEARMPPESLLPISRDTPLFTNAELDAASVPEDCFIRSILTRVKTPRFKNIAPGLEVPHDASAFAARQKFTGLPRDPEAGTIIPAVLIFAAADSSRTIGFNKEIRWLFFTAHDDVPYGDHHPIPVGLYSESLDRSNPDTAEEGFRLLLPFKLRPDFRDEGTARRSDGTLIDPESVAQLFQHGNYYPFGGEWRAQRLERLMDWWRELVETGVWIVGKDGVEGSIDKFRDADHGAWREYWIPPGW